MLGLRTPGARDIAGGDWRSLGDVPDMLASGEMAEVTLTATARAFTGWSTHAEVGSASGCEGGSEHGAGESGGH